MRYLVTYLFLTFAQCVLPCYLALYECAVCLLFRLSKYNRYRIFDAYCDGIAEIVTIKTVLQSNFQKKITLHFLCIISVRIAHVLKNMI